MKARSGKEETGGRLVLVVTEAGGCPVVKVGDRWTFVGQEVRPHNSASLCLTALYSLYPQIMRPMRGAGGAGGYAMLRCLGKGCQVVFRAEMVTTEPAESGAAAARGKRAEAAKAHARRAEESPFVARLSPQLAARLTAAADKFKCGPGEVLLHPGEKGERLFLVAEGEVEVVRAAPDGKAETVLAVLGPGECFGEMSLLTGQPTSAGVRARREALIHSISREELEKIMADSPELSRAFTAVLAERLRALNQLLEFELGRGIHGKLSAISVVEVVQTLHAGRRTGTLTVSSRGHQAHAVVRSGTVVSAMSGHQQGAEAFYTLAGWSDGEFSFEPTVTEHPATACIRGETMALLMECLRRLDEASGPGTLPVVEAARG